MECRSTKTSAVTAQDALILSQRGGRIGWPCSCFQASGPSKLHDPRGRQFLAAKNFWAPLFVPPSGPHPLWHLPKWLSASWLFEFVGLLLTHSKPRQNGPSPGANTPPFQAIKDGCYFHSFWTHAAPFSVWLEVQVFAVVGRLFPSWGLCTPREMLQQSPSGPFTGGLS